MAEIITGLDIGSSSIKGVVVTRKKDGAYSVLSVFQHPSAGFRKGILVDIEEALKTLRSVVMDLEKVSRRAAQRIFVNINGQHIRSRRSRGIVAVSRADQEIQEDDVDRVKQASQAVKLLPNYTVLHNIIAEYFVDDVGDIRDPIGMTGSRLEVDTLIIESFAPHITALVRLIEKAGGSVSGLIFSPFAASEAVLSKRQKELGVLLIDLGFSTTSCIVYEEGKAVHAKTVPVGSGHVTNDIAIGLKVSVDVAEKLKLRHGFAVSKGVNRRERIRLADIDSSARDQREISQRFLSEIMEIRLEEIFDLVNNELRDLGKLQLPAGAVLTGGGAKLAGIDELARQELKLAVQLGFPAVDDFDVSNPTHQELLDDPGFATAVGLLRWGDKERGRRLPSVPRLKRFIKNLMP